MIIIPNIKNNPWFFTYLNGSENLYSAHILEDEYTMSSPKRDKMITLINNDILNFFITTPHI